MPPKQQVNDQSKPREVSTNNSSSSRPPGQDFASDHNIHYGREALLTLQQHRQQYRQELLPTDQNTLDPSHYERERSVASTSSEYPPIIASSEVYELNQTSTAIEQIHNPSDRFSSATLNPQSNTSFVNFLNSPLDNLFPQTTSSPYDVSSHQLLFSDTNVVGSTPPTSSVEHSSSENTLAPDHRAAPFSSYHQDINQSISRIDNQNHKRLDNTRNQEIHEINPNPIQDFLQDIQIHPTHFFNNDTVETLFYPVASGSDTSLPYVFIDTSSVNPALHFTNNPSEFNENKDFVRINRNDQASSSDILTVFSKQEYSDYTQLQNQQRQNAAHILQMQQDIQKLWIPDVTASMKQQQATNELVNESSPQKNTPIQDLGSMDTSASNNITGQNKEEKTNHLDESKPKAPSSPNDQRSQVTLPKFIEEIPFKFSDKRKYIKRKNHTGPISLETQKIAKKIIEDFNNNKGTQGIFSSFKQEENIAELNAALQQTDYDKKNSKKITSLTQRLYARTNENNRKKELNQQNIYNKEQDKKLKTQNTTINKQRNLNTKNKTGLSESSIKTRAHKLMTDNHIESVKAFRAACKLCHKLEKTIQDRLQARGAQISSNWPTEVRYPNLPTRLYNSEGRLQQVELRSARSDRMNCLIYGLLDGGGNNTNATEIRNLATRIGEIVRIAYGTEQNQMLQAGSAYDHIGHVVALLRDQYQRDLAEGITPPRGLHPDRGVTIQRYLYNSATQRTTIGPPEVIIPSANNASTIDLFLEERPRQEHFHSIRYLPDNT
jgi:hypothetical protein